MNPVLYWNAILLEASRRDFTRGFNNAQQPGPIATSRAMAIVHLAIHDAVAFRNLPGAAYLTKKAGGGGIGPHMNHDVEKIVAGAAAHTLKALYPRFVDYINDSTGSEAGTLGFAYGETIGAAILAMRAADNSQGPIGANHPPVLPYGAHRADPYQPGQNRLGPNWGQVTRFSSLDSTHAFMAPFPGAASAPNYLLDPGYLADFEEVRDFGAAGRGQRTAEQERIGVYWGYDGANNLGVPPRLYNQVLRKYIADKQPNIAIGAAAELFAMANVAMADSGIDAWHWKYVFNLWRPVVGVREDALRGGDCFWAPLGAPQTNVPGRRTLTPNFPAYPSGHATFGAALYQVMRLALNNAAGPLVIDDMLAFDADPTAPAEIPAESMEFVSDELDGIAADPDGSTRTRVPVRIRSFAQGVWENSVSRIYLGVHWRFDGLPRTNADPDVGGCSLGLKIGQEAFDVFNNGVSLTGNP